MSEQTQHDKIVSALTQWDIRQSKRDKQHNWRFLGIALVTLASVEEDMPEATLEEVCREAFNGRCLDFILKTCLTK